VRRKKIRDETVRYEVKLLRGPIPLKKTPVVGEVTVYGDGSGLLVFHHLPYFYHLFRKKS
jgi:hypothetical protein